MLPSLHMKICSEYLRMIMVCSESDTHCVMLGGFSYQHSWWLLLSWWCDQCKVMETKVEHDRSETQFVEIAQSCAFNLLWT